MSYTWKDRLKDSSWVTVAWEWLQSLLGRAVDFVLWVTMIFACYQLIPGAPVPPQGASVFMFVLQFVALDIGGMSLNQIGQRHGLDTWSYTRVVAYACILVTLTTIVFAGMQHAMEIDQATTTVVEVILVIARSILTVLYGQAVRAIKLVEHVQSNKTADLESGIATLQSELGTAQGLVGELTSHLQEQEKASALLVSERDTLTLQIDLKRQELAAMREMLSGGQDWSQQQLLKLQERLDSEQDVTANLRLQLQSLELQKNELSQKLHLQMQTAELQKNEMEERLSTATLQIEGLQKDLQSEKLQTAKLQKTADTQPAKSPARTAKNLPANVTAIEDAKQRIAHAEILEYIAKNPGLKRAEVAANLGISERKVYDAIAWGREHEEKNTASG